MTDRILVLSPGEAAARVARTCKRFGATAITVSVGESGGVHVDACDEVVVVPSLEPLALVEAARASRATAAHPGYASMAEVRALRAAWPEDAPRLLAPSEAALHDALDRRRLREVAEATSVRFVEGASVGFEKLADAIEAADALTYPIRLRLSTSGVAPSRRIDDEDALFASWDELHAAAKAVGATVMVEREVHRARRIDVLVAVDTTGEAIALAEVEIALAESGVGVDLEESPSPELEIRPDGEAVRLAMFESAARIVPPLGLVGLVTVRFFFDADGHFHVAGLRAGLPRHHGAIEMVSGLDLVSLELALHAGAPMPDEVHSMQPSGHALGASLRAQDGQRVPVREVRAPPQPQRKVRFDPSVLEGHVPPAVDRDLLMRIASYGPIRHVALLGLDRMLAEVDVAPYRTNARSLRAVLADDAYRAGKFDATLAERLRYPR